MSTADAPAPPASLAEHVRARLTGAPAPLKFADVMKGFKKPAKTPKAAFEAEVRRVLEDEAGVGRAFRYPSGMRGAERYWARDEKQRLRDEAVRLASEPRAMAWLKKELAKPLKSDGAFVEAVVRELIGEDRLYEHAGKKGPAFASFPPPPPLPWHAQPKFKKHLDAAVKAAAKVLAKTGVTPDELTVVLRERLGGDQGASAETPFSVTPAATRIAEPHPAPAPAADGPNEDLDALILSAVANAGPGSVLSLADLRQGLPVEYRGTAFDEAVLRLAEAGRVRVYQDADPLQFTPGQRAEFVADGYGHVFTAVGKQG